jgi:hypothetical protein
MGYPIIKTNRGFYIERKLFSVDEVSFVKNAIINACGKSEPEKEALAERVADILTTKYQR